MPFTRLFAFLLIGLLTVLSFNVVHSKPSFAKICKDSVVHYVPGVLSKDKYIAQNSALESWRKTYSLADQKMVLPKSKDLKCMRDSAGSGWRCFVKASACAAS
jgi:hypothetical protein